MKVGDYVRTYSGFIGKVEYIETDEFGSSTYHFEKTFTEKYDNDIKLVKEKPIELIEVGDYVNGCKIIDICIDEMTNLKYLVTDITECDDIYAFGYINIYEKDIRTIVTKEQFSSMEYKVESEAK